MYCCVHCWFQSLNIFLPQISQQKQLTPVGYNTPSSGSFFPMQLNQLTGIANDIGTASTVQHTSLRAQVQPFQSYTPQQVQEQLQQLHIQQRNEPEVMLQSTATGVDTVRQQQQQQFRSIDSPCADDGRESSPTKDTNSSSFLHHLLSRSAPMSIPPPNTAQSNCFNYHQPRRPSYPDSGTTTAPHLASHLRHHTHSPEYFAMMGNIASQTKQELPTFPVTIQTRDGSPTKSLGRRSPNHDMQMASIAEDTTECNTRTPESSTSPINSMHGMFQDGEDMQQRRPLFQGMQSKAAFSMLMEPQPQQQQQQQPYSHGANGTHGLTLGYTNNFFVQQHNNHLSTPIMTPAFNLYSNSILTRISTVLSNNGMQHWQSNGGLVVEHDGVKLQIVCNLPHLNTIQMQYIAGDTMQYETLSSQLATQLQFVE